MDHLIPIFLWHILLAVEDSYRKRTPIDHPTSIFLRRIFLPVGDSHRKRTPEDNPIFLWRILFPVRDNHGFGQNIPLPWTKYPLPMAKIPPSHVDTFFKYPPNEHVPC